MPIRFRASGSAGGVVTVAIGRPFPASTARRVPLPVLHYLRFLWLIASNAYDDDSA